MHFRSVGKTGLTVSAIGFGASGLGEVFGAVTLEDSIRTVQHAVAKGINLFDVSPYYGLTVAEDRLGQALLAARKDVILSTKCGRYGADRFDFSAATITAEFENSLKRLRTDYVDILFAHDIEFGNIELVIEETLPAMRRLQQQGKARFIGITGYWPALLARTAQRVPVDVILNYCHANLMMDDMHETLTPFARRAGIGLFNASPLHMGLLSGNAPPAWHPASDDVKQAAKDVATLCKSYGLDPVQVALHACLEEQRVSSTFVGMVSVAQVDANCAALDLDPPLSLMDAIAQRVKPVFNTCWSSGRAENEYHGDAALTATSKGASL